LATGAQNEHQPVDDLALIHGALVASALGGRDQCADYRPLVIRQVAGITQLAAVIPGGSRSSTSGCSCESGSRHRITSDSKDSRCSRIDTKQNEEQAINRFIIYYTNVPYHWAAKANFDLPHEKVAMRHDELIMIDSVSFIINTA
jgi:hypothetical protein